MINQLSILEFILYSTGLQYKKPIWLHGEHFPGGEDKLLWEESWRISEGRSNEQTAGKHIHTWWKFLTI